VGLERHELSGRAKDMGSAAVSLSIILFFVIWGTIVAVNFYPA
jgi:diacylglycerol kinase (ATP)